MGTRVRRLYKRASCTHCLLPSLYYSLPTCRAINPGRSCNPGNKLQERAVTVVSVHCLIKSIGLDIKVFFSQHHGIYVSRETKQFCLVASHTSNSLSALYTACEVSCSPPGAESKGQQISAARRG